MSAPKSGALLALLPFVLATLPAQEAPKPGSPESQALLDKACQKMLAVGRGAFKTTEEQDNPLSRQLNRGGGGDSEDGGAEGGWLADMLWARATDADLIVRQRGRTVVQTGKDWRIRHNKLPSGAPMPHLFDPDLFFQLVRDLPATTRRVCAVEPAKIGDRDVLVLALTLEGEAAVDFALSGVLPPVGAFGGMSTVVMRAGAGARPAQPQPQMTVDLGLFVDPQGGDVLRVRAKLYEKGVAGPMRFAVAGGPGGAGGFQVAAPAPAEAEKEADKGKDTGELVYKKGLPERRTGQQDSSMYLKVDFSDLGKAKAPELDDAGKRLLGR